YRGTEADALARYYEADTLRLIGQNREALDAFGTIAIDYPRSKWGARSRLGAALTLVALGNPYGAMEELQRVRLRFPGTEDAATAMKWNTALYRLHVRSPAQPAFVFAGHTLPAAPGKLKDVNAIVVGPSRDDLFMLS